MANRYSCGWDLNDCHNWDLIGYPGEFVYGDDMYIPDYYMDELWKPVVNFENEYWISDYGRLWSIKKQRFLKAYKLDNWGHVGFSLCKNGVVYKKYVHRIMAEAFVPNPNNYPIVRHIDDDPSNNIIDNLAWGTNKDNTWDSIYNGTFVGFTNEDREKAWKACRVPIVATHLKTGAIFEFEGVGIASRALKICRTGISKVLTGVKKECCGYSFTYLERGDMNG